MKTNELAELIEATANRILDEWTAEAAAANIPADDYIGDRLDELEETEPEVCQTVSAAYLRRVTK